MHKINNIFVTFYKQFLIYYPKWHVDENGSSLKIYIIINIPKYDWMEWKNMSWLTVYENYKVIGLAIS